MELRTVNIAIFLCFIFKRAVSVRVFLVDISDEDIDNSITDQDDAYYNYEQIPTRNLKHKPKLTEKLLYDEKDVKFCKRFGNMYGLDTNKHKCHVLLRMNEKIKKQNENNKLTDKAGHNIIMSLINDAPNRFSYPKPDGERGKKPTHKRNVNTGHDFSQDYVDDFWRSTSYKNGPQICTVNDIINNKCKLHLNTPNQLKSNLYLTSDFKLDVDKEKNPTHVKEEYTGLDSRSAEFSQDYVDQFWRSNNVDIQNHPEIKSHGFKKKSDDGKKRKQRKLIKHISADDLAISQFTLDYVDDYLKNDPISCTLKDIINNKCKLNVNALKSLKSRPVSDSKLNEKETKSIENTDVPLKFAEEYVDVIGTDELLRACETSNDPICKSRRNNFIRFKPNQFRSSRYSDSDASDRSSASEEKPKNKKPKRFQIIRNKKNKKQKKKTKKPVESSDYEVDESRKSSDEISVEVFKPKRVSKPENIKSEESDIENDLTTDEIDTSDSFETGPKKASDKYVYLQGHRFVKPKSIKSVRRSSRLETFLPKRYDWKINDIHHLGYFWFEGPKGAFPSDYM